MFRLNNFTNDTVETGGQTFRKNSIVYLKQSDWPQVFYLWNSIDFWK